MGFIGKDAWRIKERKRKIMSQAVRQQLAPGKFKLLRHGQTHYQLAGDPAGPLLVCIHGWTTASYVWEQLREEFANLGYLVLTYDLYGRNFSDRPPNVAHTADLYSDQLTELIEQLGLSQKRLNIVGYSMGGAIAAHFVNRRIADVDRLLLIAPAGMEIRAPKARSIALENPELFDPHILLALPVPLRWQFRRAAFGFWNKKPVREVRKRQFRELDYKGYVPALLACLKGILAKKMSDEHRRIAERDSISVKALFADGDRTIPWPEAKTLFDEWNTNQVSVQIRGAGHGLTYTHVEPIMNETRGFMALESPGR